MHTIIKICFTAFIFLFLYPFSVFATPKSYKDQFDSSYSDFSSSSYYTYVTKVPYSNFPYLSGLATMYETTQDIKYLDLALQLIENSFAARTDVDGDGYLEWKSWGNLYQFDHDKNPDTNPRLSCLYTERGIKEISRIARIIKNEVCLDNDYKYRADAIIQTIKDDIINDPSCYYRFKPGYSTVHHIVSHPASILLNLYLAGEDTVSIKGENFKIIEILNTQTQAMKSTQFSQPENDGTIFWGSTSCKDLNTEYPACYFVNVSGVPPCRDSNNTPWCYPSDISHANDYVYATLEFYRSGITYNKNDIKLLSDTLVKKVWNQDPENPRFKDFLDGNLEPEGGKYGAWKMGSNIAPGWVSLGAFDSSLQEILTKVDPNTLNKVGFYSELHKNPIVKDCKYSNRSKEIADGIDNDCDGLIDENLSCGTNPGCFGDLAGNDCIVDIKDLLALIEQVLDYPHSHERKYDLDQNNVVDVFDILFILELFNK